MELLHANSLVSYDRLTIHVNKSGVLECAVTSFPGESTSCIRSDSWRGLGKVAEPFCTSDFRARRSQGGLHRPPVLVLIDDYGDEAQLVVVRIAGEEDLRWAPGLPQKR